MKGKLTSIVAVGASVGVLVGVTAGLGVAVGEGVAVGATLAAAFTAAKALTMPAPQRVVVQLLPLGNGLALVRKSCPIWGGVKPPLTANMSAAIPATCGEAILVPA